MVVSVLIELPRLKQLWSLVYLSSGTIFEPRICIVYKPFYKVRSHNTKHKRKFDLMRQTEFRDTILIVFMTKMIRYVLKCHIKLVEFHLTNVSASMLAKGYDPISSLGHTRRGVDNNHWLA